MPATSVRQLARQWNDRLAHFRRHKNVEHLDALVEEAVRYSGLHLENDLCDSEYWSKAPLARRVAVLLYLVDRGVVTRESLQGRIVFNPSDSAEAWAADQPTLSSYLAPTLELIASLRNELERRSSRLTS